MNRPAVPPSSADRQRLALLIEAEAIQLGEFVELLAREEALLIAGDVDALVALGCIIRGETYHFELVANESGAGVTRISLDHGLPIANAILTVENLEQAQARQVEKGVDAARVAVEMALLLETMAEA